MFTQNMNYRLASDTLLEETIFLSDLELASKKWNLQSSAEQYKFYRANGIVYWQ